MSYPMPLPVRVGKDVSFKPPKAVADSPTRKGKVIESIASGPHLEEGWGYYYYVSDLIEWPDRTERRRSIRLAYYYASVGSKRWIWGGQYSIEDTPDIIGPLLQRTLDQAHWFKHE